MKAVVVPGEVMKRELVWGLTILVVLTAGTLPVSKSTFMLIYAVLLVIAAVIALVMQGADTNKVMYTIFVFTRTVRIVQVGLMLILVVLSIAFGFYWSSGIGKE